MNDSVNFSTDQRRILLIASLVSSLVMLDSNVVAVALPTIARSLGADFADMQWVITAYVLPFAALLLAAGSLGDMIGRRRAALIGQGVFAIASLGCGLATSPLILNVSRALQGAGAAVLLTAALAVIGHSFRGATRARAFAFWGASLGIAITCGPIIGGVISSFFGWQWAFLINLPICAVLIAATAKFVPESSDPESKRLDYSGIATFSGGLFLITWAVIDGNAKGWLSNAVLWRLIVGIILLTMFVLVERIQKRPMVDFEIFRSRHFIGTGFAMLGYAAGSQVMIFYLPLFVQNAYGFTPIAAGLAMLPFALPMFLVPRWAARLGWHSRQLICCGLAVSTVANISMGLLAMSRAPYVSFAMAMVLAGIGAGLLNGETAKAMQGALPPHRTGMASGISATTRFTALLFGVAGLGAILIGVTARAFTSVAQKWGVDPSIALSAAKRFAAGDSQASIEGLPRAVREHAADALRQAFDTGFGATALTAAAGAFLAMVVVRWLMHHMEVEHPNKEFEGVIVIE